MNLTVAGTICFRDLGGLTTDDGWRVRHRYVFRSSGLEELTAADVDALCGDVGLRTIFDLREGDEVDRDGVGPLPAAGVRHVHSPLIPPGTDPPGGSLADRYRGYLHHGAPSIVSIIEAMAAGGTVPAVIHCVAGKDRTGVVVAALLAALGISRDQIVTDYAFVPYEPDEFLCFLRRRASCGGILDHLDPSLFGADPGAIDDLLSAVERDHGGMDAFLHSCGLRPGTLERLRAALLEPHR